MEGLDLKDLVINRKMGVYFINIKDKDKLSNQLRSLNDDGVLEKYNMTCSYTIYNEYITVGLYEPFEYKY